MGRSTETGPVLYVDWETDERTARERLWLLAAGRGDEEPPPILYRRMTRPLVEDLVAVQRMRDREGAVLTIIDSQGYAIGSWGSGDPAGPVLAFYGAARELGGTVLGIDHRSDDDAHSKRPKPYGSVYKMNAARSLWLAKSSQEPGAADVHVGLFHTLANNYGLQRPIGFHVTFTEDAVSIVPEDARDVPLLREGLSAPERILLALREGPKSTVGLGQELDLSVSTIRQACNREKDKGRVMKVGGDNKDGAIWGLISGREDDPS